MTTTQHCTTATGGIEIQPRVVPNASVFNFFSPPEIPKIGKLEPREGAILDEDFEIGQILHDNVILKSVYDYTGEVNGIYDDGKDYGNRKRLPEKIFKNLKTLSRSEAGLYSFEKKKTTLPYNLNISIPYSLVFSYFLGSLKNCLKAS